MRRVATKVLAGAAALVLSTALLAGCGAQGAATDSPDAQADAAAQEEVEPEPEPEPEPAMSNWTENAFYERPFSEITSDLELLGFEMTGEESYSDTDALGDVVYYFLNYQGTPEDNPVEGSDETVEISFTIENPTLLEGESEYTTETIDPQTTLTGFNVGFFLPEADTSEYGTVAASVAEAVGLPELTEDYVGDPFGTGRVIGNFLYQDTFKGTETESMLIISSPMSEESLPNPDTPLYVSYGPYVSERA